MTRYFLTFLLCFGLELHAATERPVAGNDYAARRGLPRTAAQRAKSGEFRVAYLGGSITAADGWRILTTTFLRTLLPRANVREIAAGVPGTGSDLGACRIGTDVLQHRPDLLFVEFAVNDAGTSPAQIERTMEGIVRQTWRANPATDICFVYTISTPGLPAVSAGRQPASAEAMEKVAEHYGIPTVQLGFEVARQVSAGQFVFKGTESDDLRAFSLDGVHPTPAGHQLYGSVLRRVLPELIKQTKALHALPPPLHSDNWERAEQRPLEAKLLHGAWAKLASDDPSLRGITKALLPTTWRTEHPEAAIEFEFKGTKLGLLGIAAPDNGSFVVEIDGGNPVTDTLFDAYVTPSFCRVRPWFYPTELPPGRHHVTIRLSAAPLDKAGIKKSAGKPLADTAPFSGQRLTLSGLLLVDTGPEE